jgi:hypothetical protein
MHLIQFVSILNLIQVKLMKVTHILENIECFSITEMYRCNLLSVHLPLKTSAQNLIQYS